jgi:cyclopropane-fatty-acyl-phospholipid synthase
MEFVQHQRVAIVGSGIAGLTCAHVLGPHHDVVQFEAESRLGGHANTVDVVGPHSRPTPRHTGFIVHNDRNYQNLVPLFEELGVATVDTEMSFSVTDRDLASPTNGFTYCATSPNTVFADRRNVVRPAMWRMLREIRRFHRDAMSYVASGDDITTLEEFLTTHRYGREFIELHLIPMGAAVWSADPTMFGGFPARSLFSFLDQHGLLSIGDRPQWRTIPGGSRVYVDAIARSFPGEIRLGEPVQSVERPDDGGAVVVTTNGRTPFNRVVLAVHSDQALAMIERASPVEGKILLRRLYRDRLTLHDRIPGRTAVTSRYGVADASIEATLVVHDARAYSAVFSEGSVGLGRGFIEGWWTSDDPVAVVRVLIRNLSKLDEARNRLHHATSWATDRIRKMLPHGGRDRNREDIAAHYDIGNTFFELFLDETMTYSSAVFPSTESTLAEASLHKYDLLLDKFGVTAEHRLLEIGTGWGGMAIRAAGTTGCHVTTTTISAEQLREAERRVDDAGLSGHVTLRGADWRDLSGKFDRVVSIEMIEAVDWRDYDDYFSTIDRCLTPGGSAAIQAICVPDERWERAKNTKDFIRRLVFPNGFLPSVGAIEQSVGRATKMRVVGIEEFTPHYAETLRRWRERFDSRIDDVAALGLDERFQRLWRFYLAYCEAESAGLLHQIRVGVGTLVSARGRA